MRASSGLITHAEKSRHVFVLLVTCHIKPKMKRGFLEASMENANFSLRESGCRRCDIIEDAQDPDVIYFYEAYKDRSASEHHSESSYVRRWVETVKDWLEKPLSVNRGSSVI